MLNLMPEGGENRMRGRSHSFGAGLAVLAGVFRLLPHPPNFTPVGALGLFAGARLPLWQAFAWPLAVMAGTDLVLWRLLGYEPFNPYVYASLLFTVLLGRFLRNTTSPWKIGAASLGASVQFFLVTNFGAWLAHATQPPMFYSADLQGLLACYVAALPFFNTQAPPLGFFGNTLLGDLTFSALLFGAHALLSRRVRVADLVPAPAVHD